MGVFLLTKGLLGWFPVFYLTKTMVRQSLGLSISRLAQFIMVKSTGVHLVERRDNSIKHHFALMQFKNFLETSKL